MNILVLDRLWTGHKSNFLKILVSGLGEGASVLALGAPESAKRLGQVGEGSAVSGRRLTTCILPEPLFSPFSGRLLPQLLRNEIRNRDFARAALGHPLVGSRRFDAVVFPFADNSALAARAMAGGLPATPALGLFMLPRQSFLAGVWQRIGISSFELPVYLSSRSCDPGVPSRFRYQTVDPVEASLADYPQHPGQESGCGICGMGVGRPFDVVLYGGLSARKNVGLFLDLVEMLSGCLPQFQAGVFGEKHDLSAADESRLLALVRSGNCQWLPRRLTSLEEAHLLKSTKMVWLGYRGRAATSGVQRLFGFAGVPSITLRGNGLDEAVSRTGSGIVLSGSVGQDATALLAVLKDDRIIIQQGRACREIYGSCTAARFVEDISKLISAWHARHAG